MADIFVFGNYAAVADFMCRTSLAKSLKLVLAKKSFRLYGLKLFAKTEVNLSFGLKPDFRSGLSFGLNR